MTHSPSRTFTTSHATAPAQLDFSNGGEAGRLYVETHAPARMDAPSFPWRGFSLLGPIPREAVDLAAVKPAAVRKHGWTMPDGKKLAFQAVAAGLAQPLCVEVIPVRGRWDSGGLKPCVYLLASTVTSPTRRAARFAKGGSTLAAIWLNGARADAKGELIAGANKLLLAYVPPTGQRFSPEHAGPSFRIVDAATGKRLTDITYRP